MIVNQIVNFKIHHPMIYPILYDLDDFTSPKNGSHRKTSCFRLGTSEGSPQKD